jgi:hypothetical protein
MAWEIIRSASETIHLVELWRSFNKESEGRMGKPMRISYSDISNAYHNFLKLENHMTNHSMQQVQHRIAEFEKFIGHSLTPPTLEILNDNEDAVARIKWMSGPHAETLYKAWKAKHG